MSTFTPLNTDTAWFRLHVDDGDWRNEDPILLARLLEQVFLVRRFEEKLIELLGEGLVHGPVHTTMCRPSHGIHRPGNSPGTLERPAALSGGKLSKTASAKRSAAPFDSR